MPRFLVRLDGINLMLEDVQGRGGKRVGFLATRIVEAANEDEAISIAKKLVSDEVRGSAIRQHPDRPLSLTVDAISQLNEWDEPDLKGGFTFYPDEDH